MYIKYEILNAHETDEKFNLFESHPLADIGREDFLSYPRNILAFFQILKSFQYKFYKGVIFGFIPYLNSNL